jgi:hypothetical protein
VLCLEYTKVSGQPHTLGKEPWYPSDKRLGGAQSQSGCCGKEKNLSQRRFKHRFLNHVTSRLVTILNELFQLQIWTLYRILKSGRKTFQKTAEGMRFRLKRNLRTEISSINEHRHIINSTAVGLGDQ